MHAALLRPVSAVALATVLGCTLYTPSSQAFDFGNMMNPSRWMGNDRRHDDGPYDYPAPYGAPPYGMPYGVPGFGAPPPGYAVPNGWYQPAPGAAPMVQPAAPAAVAPVAPAPTASTADKSEVEALKRRIEELEAKQRQQTPPAAPPARQPQSTDWPAAPAFRPMNQY